MSVLSQHRTSQMQPGSRQAAASDLSRAASTVPSSRHTLLLPTPSESSYGPSITPEGH